MREKFDESRLIEAVSVLVEVSGTITLDMDKEAAERYSNILSKHSYRTSVDRINYQTSVPTFSDKSSGIRLREAYQLTIRGRQ